MSEGPRRSNYKGNNYIENYRPRSRYSDSSSRPRPRYSEEGSSTYRPRNDTSNASTYRPRSNASNSSSYRPRNDNASTSYRPRNSNSSSYRPRSDTAYKPRYENDTQSRTSYTSESRPRSSSSTRYRQNDYRPRSSRYNDDRNDYQRSRVHGSNDLIHVFSSIVAQRYRQDISCLDLSNIAQDPLIKQKQINLFDHHSNAMPAFVKYLSETLPNLETINFAQNPISSTAALHSLFNLPKLKNLSFQGTNIRLYADLDHMNVPNLKNLLLKDTPLYNSEMSKGGSYYKDEVLKRFPSLKILDDQQIKGIEFEVPHSTFPVTILPGVVMEQEKVIDFIGKYFQTFDTNREVLQAVYLPDAYFSLQLNKPRSAPMADYAQYSQLSRNMKFTTDSQRRLSALYYGNEVGQALMMLPGTIHTFLVDHSKILFDAYSAGAYLVIVIHSEFQDLSTSMLVGFDRVFLLNSEMKVKSDMLTIRTNTILPLTMPADLSPQQRELVLQFVKETGMNLDYSILCLREHGFSYSDAKETFLKVRQSGDLPPEAMSI